jgi:hypothetical protein
LFPDWPYQLDGNGLNLVSPHGNIRVSVEGSALERPDLQMQLIRAGMKLYGEGDFPAVLGWYSPTYNSKMPALSLRASFAGRLPARLVTFIALDRPSISR